MGVMDFSLILTELFPLGITAKVLIMGVDPGPGGLPPNILVGGAQPLEGPLNNFSVTRIGGKNSGSIY